MWLVAICCTDHTFYTIWGHSRSLFCSEPFRGPFERAHLSIKSEVQMAILAKYYHFRCYCFKWFSSKHTFKFIISNNSHPNTNSDLTILKYYLSKAIPNDNSNATISNITFKSQYLKCYHSNRRTTNIICSIL